MPSSNGHSNEKEQILLIFFQHMLDRSQPATQPASHSFFLKKTIFSFDGIIRDFLFIFSEGGAEDWLYKLSLFLFSILFI